MSDFIIVGRVNGLFGTRGWIKVFSYTRPRENLLAYNAWHLRDGASWQPYEVGEAKRHGSALIASLHGVADRDAAAALLRRDIALVRGQLGPPGAGEYYWVDLIGLEVVNREGRRLGRVAGLVETGAHDVLRVQGDGECLIPFVEGVTVDDIDWDAGEIRVDWRGDD